MHGRNNLLMGMTSLCLFIGGHVSAARVRVSRTGKTVPSIGVIVLGCAMGLAIALGSNFAAAGDGLKDIGYSKILDPGTWIVWAFSALFCTLAIWGLYAVLDVWRASRQNSLGRFAHVERATRVSPKRWLLAAVIIFLLWLPVWLIFFPGLFVYDTLSQLSQILGGAGLNTQHPPLHTLFVSLTVGLGYWISGSAVVGGAFYAATQMALCAAAYGWLCAEIERITSRKWPFVAAILWFGVCPLNSILAISCTKDVLFSASFSVFVAWLGRFASGLSLGEKQGFRVCVPLFSFGLLASLLRNNMAIALLAFILVLVVMCLVVVRKGAGSLARAMTKRAILPLVAVMVAYFVISGPVFRVLGIQSTTGTRETLSVPAQQLARVAVLGGELSEQDKEFIAAVYPDYDEYLPGIADPVKGTFNLDYFNSNKIYFFSEYIKIGLKNPLAYLDAWLDMSHRGWFPEAIGGTQDAWGWHPYLDMHVDGQDMFERYGVGWLFVPDSSVAPDTRKWLTDFIAAKPWERVPVLRDLMSTGSAIWWFVVGAGYLFHSHRFRIAFVMAMVVLYWGTLLLGPCILARYVYPLFVLLPWLFAVVAFTGESAVATRSSCG